MASDLNRQSKIFNSLVALLHALDAWPHRGSRQRAVFYFTKNTFGFLRILPREQQDVIQLNPRFARILHCRAIEFEPVAESLYALLLRRPQGDVVSLRQTLQAVSVDDLGGGGFRISVFFGLNFVPIFKQLPPAECDGDNNDDDD